MAKKSKISLHFENYPRIQEKDHEFEGFLDDGKLVQHAYTLTEEELERIILDAIEKANAKSGREIMPIGTNATPPEIAKIFEDKAWDLFKYFQAYPGDPASTAHQLEGKDSKIIEGGA